MRLDVSRWTIDDVHRALRAGEASAAEICSAAFSRIAEENPKNNSFLAVTEERAMARAAEIDRRVASQEALAPLAGVPVAVKDVILTEGIRTTCASRILGNFVPPYSATAVQRIE